MIINKYINYKSTNKMIVVKYDNYNTTSSCNTRL